MTTSTELFASVHPELSVSEETSGRVITVTNPATFEETARFRAATPQEMDEVVERAAAGHHRWNEISPPERSSILWRFGELVSVHHEELAKLDVACTGKVIRDAIPEAQRASRHARYWSGWADKILGEQLPEVPGRFSYAVRESLGVYVVILPWNAPTHGFMARVMPALACGNAVIVKPSELSPLSATRLAQIGREAGLPEGVLNVVLGDGQAGGYLSSHPGVSGVSFTGSVATGRAVATAGAQSFKKVTLELGGKSPIVVFEDADLDSAARAAVLGIAVNAGQICAASSRLLVQDSIADEFSAEVRRRLDQVQVGDPWDEDSYVGPVVCQTQFDKVTDFIEAARRDGSQILGDIDADEASARDGLYVRPMLIRPSTSESRVLNEEVFGPVLSLQEFKTEQEAIEIANQTEFGLAAYIWTSDVGRMFRVANALQAGAVHGNSPLVLDPALPFGGYKNSGLGGAYGAEAIDGCTRVKRVTLRIADEPLPSPWAGI